MLSLLESLGTLCAPYLPFVNGQNAATAFTVGCIMTGAGALTLIALSIIRLLGRKGGKA